MAGSKEREPIKLTLVERINIKEFLHTLDMTVVQKAGFIAYAGKKQWMRPDEWQSLLDEYSKL